MDDLDDSLKQDKEAQRWLNEIESYRSPPPPRKLFGSHLLPNEDLEKDQGPSRNAKNSAHRLDGDDFDSRLKKLGLGFTSKNAENCQTEDDGEDFTSKLRQFQLSDSHPYASKKRVETTKKIATQGSLNGHVISIDQSRDKPKPSLNTDNVIYKGNTNLIDKQAIEQLRDDVKKTSRPIIYAPVNNLAACQDQKNDANGLNNNSDKGIYASLPSVRRAPDDFAPIFDKVGSPYRVSDKIVHTKTSSYDLSISNNNANGDRVYKNNAKAAADLINASSDKQNTSLIPTTIGDNELRDVFNNFDRDFKDLSARNHSASPAFAANSTTKNSSSVSILGPPPYHQTRQPQKVPPPFYRRNSFESAPRNTESDKIVAQKSIWTGPESHVVYDKPSTVKPVAKNTHTTSRPVENLEMHYKSPEYNPAPHLPPVSLTEKWFYDNNRAKSSSFATTTSTDSTTPASSAIWSAGPQQNSVESTPVPVLGSDLLAPSARAALERQQEKFEQFQAEIERELEEKAVDIGVCCECHEKVTNPSDATQALGRLYHVTCFTCCSCGRTLTDKKFYEVGGKRFCEEDYLFSGYQQSAERCAKCGHFIMDMILQAVGKSFHPSCFRCTHCKESLDGVPFTMDDKGAVFCVTDYHRLFAPKCAKCQKPITPVSGRDETVRVVAMQNDYHVDCYICEVCGLQLTDEPDKRCYPLGDHLLCQKCHVRWSKSGGHIPPITDL